MAYLAPLRGKREGEGVTFHMKWRRGKKAYQGDTGDASPTADCPVAGVRQKASPGVLSGATALLHGDTVVPRGVRATHARYSLES